MTILYLTGQDYERTEHYRFVVAGTDRGSPPLSSTATVYINVKDVNDNAPEFSAAVYRAAVQEDAPPGSSILAVQATGQLLKFASLFSQPFLCIFIQ